MKLLKLIALLPFLVPGVVLAQPPGPPGARPPPPKTAKDAAPVDLTGYWVSVVSEDWRWRMVTPIRGDFQSIPLNTKGREVGLAWDPAADAAAGEQCKAYGAPAVMRIPGRVRITWADDQTLKVETDAGMQTRLFHFAPPADAPTGPPGLQGHSVANWERPLRGQLPTGDILPIFGRRSDKAGGSLEVSTTHLRPGYYRKNGPPYSANARLEEYYDYHAQPNGDQWFTVTTVVHDPTYLASPFITSTDFRKQPNANGWDPTPCSVQ